MRAACLLIAAMTAALLSGCVGGEAMHTGHETRPPDPATLRRGERQFRVSCAGCHGSDATGNGPIAPLLTVPVPDLTHIAARRGGRFPDDEIYRIVDGQAELSAHGPRRMPVWGYEFFGDDPDDEAAHRQASERIERIVAYLRSLQRQP